MNRFSYDTFFQQGTTHTVCQDYAAAGTCDGYPYIVIADGCSGSADSDTGARILARCAAAFVSLLDTSCTASLASHFANLTIRQARRCLLPGLERPALDATLIIATTLADRFRVLAFGDGVIFSGNQEQNKIIEFSDSAPFYLNYLEDDDRLRAYRGLAPKVRVNGGEETDPEQTSLLFDFPFTETDRIGIGSDGWLTLVNEQGVTRELSTFEAELLAFRTRAGAFVQRRVRNGLMRKLASEGFAPADDVAFAALIKD